VASRGIRGAYPCLAATVLGIAFWLTGKSYHTVPLSSPPALSLYAGIVAMAFGVTIGHRAVALPLVVMGLSLAYYSIAAVF